MNFSNQTFKISKRGQHRLNYYQENKEKFLLAQRKYRAKLKTNKPPKTTSEFQQRKTKKFLKLLVNYRSFVPVPQGLKHPIIKNWNVNNYWYNKQLDLNNLARGCVRIFKDNWKDCFVIWLDI